jgi:hypothetical protein
VSLPDKAPLIARCSSDNDLRNCAEKKALLLGQLYAGSNSLWAPFVTIIVQFVYCLVLYWHCCHASKTFYLFTHQDLHAKNHHCISIINAVSWIYLQNNMKCSETTMSGVVDA